MGKTYRITLTNAADITEKISQISTEQAALIAKLKITVANPDTGELAFSSTEAGNPFTVTVKRNYAIEVLEGATALVNNFLVGNLGTADYIDVHCTANSMMIVSGTTAIYTDSTMYNVAVISANNDDSVVVVATSLDAASAASFIPNFSDITVKDGSYNSISNVPKILDCGLRVNNFEQFSLVNIPESTDGKYCDNVYLVAAYNQRILSSLVILNDTEYACAMPGWSNNTNTACSPFIMCK